MKIFYIRFYIHLRTQPLINFLKFFTLYHYCLIQQILSPTQELIPYFEISEYFKTTNHGEYNLVIDYIKKIVNFSHTIHQISLIYILMGGKQKFYKTINHHFQSIVEKSKVDRVIDP